MDAVQLCNLNLQVEAGAEDTAGSGIQQSPSAPSDLQFGMRESSPENQQLLSNSSQQQPDAGLVSDHTSQDGATEEGDGHGHVIFY